jgi:anaerobic dimethyl sulfoxide reductase subunit B (iron-sulfur subunit)
MQYGFWVDIDRCIGCGACTIACKDWNDIQPGQAVQWRRVTTIESGQVPNTQLTNVSLSCMHCAKPACVAVCPTSAITKRAEDGVVVVDSSKCIGCRYCFFACPLGVPQYGKDGTMQKCNLCLDRLQQGEKPTCVVACPVGALHGGPIEELAKSAAEKAATRLAGATDPSVLISK